MKIFERIPVVQMLLLVFFISFGLLYSQQIAGGFFRNLEMVWALDLVIDEHAIKEDKLEFITKILGRQSDTAPSSFSSRNLLLGNLYWHIGDEHLATRYWMEGGVGPDFFISKLDATTREENLDYIDRALSLSPNRSELLYYKGLYFEKGGDSESAEYWYRLAETQNNWIDLGAGFAVLYERGALLFEREQWEKAKEVLLKAESLSPAGNLTNTRKLAMVKRWLGIIYQEHGESRIARLRFLQAVVLYPQDFWNHLSLALIAEEEKQSPEIVFQYFDRARQVAPSNVYAYVYPAKHYLDLDQLNRWQYFCEQTPRNLKKDPQWKKLCEPE